LALKISAIFLGILGFFAKFSGILGFFLRFSSKLFSSIFFSAEFFPHIFAIYNRFKNQASQYVFLTTFWIFHCGKTRSKMATGMEKE
jgi:hypothetical protein